jgi:ATP-dependent protease ClpP protease subunit
MNDILKLYLSNKIEKTSVINLAVDSTTVTIYLQGIVEQDYGINAMDLRDAISRAGDAETIIFNINTPGGSVFESREIMDVIRNVKAKTVAHIGSLCASAGTSIALACNEVEMANGAHFMIHNAFGMAFGDKSDLRKTADFLEKLEMSIVEDYTTKTGKSAEEISAMMEDETWMTASEALEHGFIDRIAGTASVKNTWNLSAYSKAPKIEEKQEVAENIADPVIENTAFQSNENRLKLLQIL